MVKVQNKKRIFSDKVNNIKDAKKQAINPFEVHINKQKHQVLGQKLKNDRGLPGVSRAKANKRRKDTLLQEYNVLNKTNKFVDRRIGERSSTMTSEDRHMARFTAERMKSHNKKSIYNLADEELLTHRGQTLTEIEKFDDPRSDDDDDDDEMGHRNSGKLDDSFVEDAHFGGGILKKAGPDGVKSHKDLIEQLIAESKKRKAEKQKIREQTIELTEKLDTEWKDLLPLVSKSKRTEANEPDSRNVDSYDKVMRELRFEARGNPSDRLKSEEEIAKEEKERLEQLEQDRINRMTGFVKEEPKKKHRSADDLDDNFADDDSDPEVTLAYGEDGCLLINPDEKTPKPDADDADQKSDDADEKSDDADEESDDSSDDLSDLKQSESESSDDETDITETIKTPTKLKQIENTPSIKEEKRKSFTEEILDTIPKQVQQTKTVKTTQVEDKICLNKLESDESSATDSDSSESTKNDYFPVKTETKKRKIEEKDLTPVKKEKTETTAKISKIAECSTDMNIATDSINTNESQENNKNLIAELIAKEKLREDAAKELPFTFNIPENYEDLQTLLSEKTPEQQSIIIERMIKCNNPNLANNNKELISKLFAYLLQHLSDISTETNCFSILNSLLPQLFDVAQLNKDAAHESLIEVLKEKFNDFIKKPKGFPGLDVLMFLKVVSCLFPTSDFRHQVCTPAVVFINHMLTVVRPKNKFDICYGLFLVTLMLEFTALSRRYVSSAVNYLAGLLHMAIPKTGVQLIKVIPPFKPISTNLVLTNKCKCNDSDFRMKSEDFFNNEMDNSFKIRTVYNVSKMLEEFYQHYLTLPSWGEIFSPHLSFLEKLPLTHYPKEVQTFLENITSKIKDALENRKLVYLVKAAKKPKALRLYEPNIIKIVEGRNHKVMSKEKADQAKLLHKYNKERKGALREIRRDKSFLGRVKLKQRMESDRERKEKVKRIFSEASVQQAELNTLNRKKKN